jgi:hypothetical protein
LGEAGWAGLLCENIPKIVITGICCTIIPVKVDIYNEISPAGWRLKKVAHPGLGETRWKLPDLAIRQSSGTLETGFGPGRELEHGAGPYNGIQKGFE